MGIIEGSRKAGLVPPAQHTARRPLISGDRNFNPNQIADIGFCWDPFDDDTITAPSGVASAMNDTSVNNRHLLQTVLANRPSWVHGKLTCNGTDEFMTCGDPCLYDANGAVFVGALKLPNQAGLADFLNESNSANNTITNHASFIRQGSGGGDVTLNQVEFWDNATSIFLSTKFGNTPITGIGAAVYTIIDTGSNVSMRINGVPAAASGNYSRTGRTLNLNRLNLGAFFGSVTDGYAALDFGGGAGFTRVLSLAEIQQLESYYSTRLPV